MTTLMISAGNKAVNAVEFLLKHGADANARDDGGETPLHYAVTGAAAKVTTWEISGKAPDKVVEDRPEDALAVIALLLTRGAKPELVDEKGISPVSLSTKLRLKDVSKLLTGNP